MKKLSIVTILVLILSIIQNVFPTNANADEKYKSAKEIIPAYIEGNEPKYGLPWIKINADGSYEIPEDSSSDNKIIKVIREGNVYNIRYNKGNGSTLTCNYDQKTKQVSWSSNLPVPYVFMNAGSSGLLYVYPPGLSHDGGLCTPENKDLSHVSFYLEVPIPSTEQLGLLRIKKIYEGDSAYPRAFFTLKDKKGTIVKKFELLNNEIALKELVLNTDYVLYEDEIKGYEVSIIDSKSKKEVKLTAEGYSFKVTKPELISLIVKNKKIEDEPLIKCEVPEQMCKNDFLWRVILPLLGVIIFVGGVIFLIRVKRK